MKIVRLEAHNVLKLSAVQIDPSGNLIVIGGDNAAGKSSVLNCIEMALGGGKQPAVPVKSGATKGKIVLDLGDILVERRYSPKGSELSVVGKDGAKFSSPQRMLDELVGRLSFDPDSFRRMNPREQRDTLMQLVGLDFTSIDQERKAAFDQRTEVNRRVREMEARLDAAPGPHEGVPDAELSISELVAEKDARAKVNHENERQRVYLADFNEGTAELEAEIPVLMDNVDRAKLVLAEAEKELQAARTEVENRKLDAAKLAEEIAELVDADVAEITAKIDTAESTNCRIRENKAKAALTRDLHAEVHRADKFTDIIDAIDDEKAKSLAAAKFPVEGLGVSDDGVTLNGIPLEQSSGVESIKVSVAIGCRLNPKLRVVLVRNPSYIGEDYLKAIAEIADAHDCQVWLERGGHGSECTVVIADGQVEAPAEELVTSASD